MQASYAIKEIFYTLQGEGANAGHAAVFCRFAGCNLWSGREADRRSAICQFCDTDFVGTDGSLGGRYETATDLAAQIAATWPHPGHTNRLVVLTGGEPLLQVDSALIDALHGQGFKIAVETNGTILPPRGLDWICVSPKAGADLKLFAGNEIKVVVPQPQLDLLALERLPFEHRFVQPMDGERLSDNTRWAIDWCLQNPSWRLSLQNHKSLNIR
ncbi:MAG: 7-carboxy-7-deazaguanine synthase [Proteobacteria bacterium]|nr:7-carboxy-7-deazaguanine synthase [Pseudomonadota bacterium]